MDWYSFCRPTAIVPYIKLCKDAIVYALFDFDDLPKNTVIDLIMVIFHQTSANHLCYRMAVIFGGIL